MSYPIKLTKLITPIALAVSLAACGGGGSEFGSKVSDGDSTSGDIIDTTVESIDLQADSLELLADGSIPVNITAIVKNKFNNAISSAVVSYEVDGVATLNVTDNTAVLTPNGSPLGTLTVTANVGLVTKTILIEVIDTITQAESDIKLGAGDGDLFEVGALKISDNNLKAGGKTSIKVSLVDSKNNNELASLGNPNISFNSSCIANGLASISDVTFNAGIATVDYEAKGCSGTDTITATAIVDGNAIKASSDINIEAAIVGSLSFDEAEPSNIGLKGMGLNEVSTVTFTALDVEGNPVINQEVRFELSTETGGITLSSTSAITNSEGKVSAKVHSGNKATSVKVKGIIEIDGAEYEAQSRSLVISTGIADQNSFSISAQTLNPEALNYDGVTTELYVQVADHYNNPVPEGSAVYFTTEAGSIAPFCLTNESGSCTVEWRSGGTRPADGRVTILASMQGEESFVDSNGNGLLDDGESFTDLPEVFRDDNKDGTLNGTDELNDYNENEQFDVANGEYNGLLCNPVNTVNKCAADKNVYVSDDIEIIMSGSHAHFTNLPESIEIELGQVGEFSFGLTDKNGQPLPAGTQVNLEISSGGGLSGGEPFQIISDDSWDIGNTNSSANLTETVVISNEITSVEESVLQITVTTPKGTVTRNSVRLVNTSTEVEPDLATKISLSIDATQILADGSQPVVISAVAKDDDNNVLEGIPVMFSVNGEGSILKTGLTTAELTPGDTLPGEVLEVTATIEKNTGNNITKTALVSVVETLNDNAVLATKMTLSANATQIVPGVEGLVTITAVAKDDDNNVLDDIPVKFSVSGDANIKATSLNTADLTAGDAVVGNILRVTATITQSTGDIVKELFVDVVETLQVGSANSLEFTASSRQLFSAGIEPIILSAIVKDINNNTITDEIVTFSVDNDATITVNDNSGVVKTANLLPGTKENRSLNVTATVGSITQSLQVDVVGTNLNLEGPDSIAFNKPTEYLLKLKDSAGNAVTFTEVSVTTSDNSNNVITPLIANTDANGELTVSLISNTTSGDVTVSATSLNADVSKEILVSADDFTLTGTDLNGDGNVDINDRELDLGVSETITVKWLEGAVPQENEVISIVSTRGTLNTTSVVTNASGEATFTISSDTAGTATITAETSSGLTAVLDREFVSTTPAYLNAQASPSLIAPNESSTILTKVRDANDNPVKNVKVNFNLTDSINGQLSNAQAVTDSLGRAEVIYTAGADSTAFEGVMINTYLQDYTAITDDINLTVGGTALRIVLGSDNLVGTEDVFYTKTFGVIVTDSSGNPIQDQAISFTINPVEYYKGTMQATQNGWVRAATATCPTEDDNNNGSLDAGEDDNGNGFLEPTNDATVTASGVTDEDGKLTVDVVYLKNTALWSKQRITSSIVANGTEFVENTEFVLPIAASDVSDPLVSVPNQFSPYGEANVCTDPN